MPLKRTKRYDQALPLLYISDHDIAAISSQWFDIAAHQDRYSFGLAICEFGLSNATYLDVGIISSVCLFVSVFCTLGLYMNYTISSRDTIKDGLLYHHN